jgi:hypothetical protein
VFEPKSYRDLEHPMELKDVQREQESEKVKCAYADCTGFFRPRFTPFRMNRTKADDKQ